MGKDKGKGRGKGKGKVQLIEWSREGRLQQRKVSMRWGSWLGLGYSLEGWGLPYLGGCSWLNCGPTMNPQTMGTNVAKPCQVLHSLLSIACQT